MGENRLVEIRYCLEEHRTMVVRRLDWQHPIGMFSNRLYSCCRSFREHNCVWRCSRENRCKLICDAGFIERTNNETDSIVGARIENGCRVVLS